MRNRIGTLAIAAAFAVAASGCGGKAPAETTGGPPDGEGSPAAALSPVADSAGGGGAAVQEDGGAGADPGTPGRAEPAPTSAPAQQAIPALPPQEPVEVAPEALVCDPVKVHGEPHSTEPSDSDGDGVDDVCVYLGDAGHTHDAGQAATAAEPVPIESATEAPVRIDRPDEGCVELESGGWDCPEEQTQTPVLPTPEPTAEVWGGGGTGWRWDGHGRPVAERVWTQAETGSPWPPAGEGQASWTG